MKYLVGIDIGTSSAKSVLIDENGRLITWAGQEYPIDSPHPGWAEQNPQEWTAAAINTLSLVIQKSAVDPKMVAGIGLTGQMHSLVCLGEDCLPLRPAILWADRRSQDQVTSLENSLGRPQIAQWTSNRLAVGFMLASWAWLVENEPATTKATRFLLLPKDEVRLRLTGHIGCEPSDASSTLMYDTAQRCWSQPILDSVGLKTDQMPALHDSVAVAGGLLPEIASVCGLQPGTPVIFGGSDQSMQAVGQGVFEPGVVSCTIGTGGQLFAPLIQPRFNAARHPYEYGLHLFCHAIPERWHLLAATLTAGLSLRWLRDKLWPGMPYQTLADAATRVEAGLDGLFFLPHLAGERTPYMDSQVRGLFAGLDLNHGQPHLVRAVMEGVIFSLRQGLDIFKNLGVPQERLLSAGGSTRHPLWLQLEADIFNQPIYPAKTEEATACGAAILAGVGTGVYSDFQTVLKKAVQEPDSPIQPNPYRVEAYEKAYQRYLRLYPAIKQAGFTSAE